MIEILYDLGLLVLWYDCLSQKIQKHFMDECL